MARRIYWILLITTILVGGIFYLFKDNFIPNRLIWLLFFLSMMLVTSVHGIIAHTLNPQLKGGLITYPVLMGILFAVIILIYIFFILPLFFPNFLKGNLF